LTSGKTHCTTIILNPSTQLELIFHFLFLKLLRTAAISQLCTTFTTN
jgi:hypothetical protein